MEKIHKFYAQEDTARARTRIYRSNKEKIHKFYTEEDTARAPTRHPKRVGKAGAYLAQPCTVTRYSS